MDMLISLGVIMTFFLDKAIGSARCVADLVGSCGCMYIISFVCVCTCRSSVGSKARHRVL